MAKSLMIQGTGSGVGKSLIVAGLCRIFRREGINVAPFKAQNMALNSFITKEGGEIGRAQAFQAEAAYIEPSILMNPILLKATGESQCQVIVNGRVHSKMEAKDYYSFKKEAWKAVTTAYEALSRQYDLIVIEGAGSPAEINLNEDEIVNMSVARHADAPVILVGDIDKGGVFASFYGTIGLLNGDAERIKGFIVNKFRGDMLILKPGLTMIHERTGRPVLGVIPYLGDLGLHEEDGIPIERFKSLGEPKAVKIVVVGLKYISNFTDFDPFSYEPDTELIYSVREVDMENADLIIIPGSKNTAKDLLFLRQTGLEKCIKRASKKGVPLIGICGGYQMLGKWIHDSSGVESDCEKIKALGLLDIETRIGNTKITSQVEAEMIKGSGLGFEGGRYLLKGYEIHMGVSEGDIGLFKLKRVSADPGHQTVNSEAILEGSAKGNVWGTYMHGIFDDDRFRRSLVDSLRIRKGLSALKKIICHEKLRDSSLNSWAALLKAHIDIKHISEIIKG